MDYFDIAIKTIQLLDFQKIENLVDELFQLRKRNGRLFLIGVGGSAANCSHAVNDFRKLVGIEAYCPTDNVSEVTARTNDEGWESIFSSWLKISKASSKDALLVFSVGGGDIINNISPNIVRALEEAKNRKMSIFGIIGRKEGYTNQIGNVVVVIPCLDSKYLTPISESFQALLWHYIVSHPKLKISDAKWESVDQQENLVVK
jgi:D-sedoheptulose 7-phosphate isomerase